LTLPTKIQRSPLNQRASCLCAELGKVCRDPVPFAAQA
jgi:hypothetical protein